MYSLFILCDVHFLDISVFYLQNTGHAEDVVKATPAPFMMSHETSCDTPNNSCLGDVLDGIEDTLEVPPEPVRHVSTSTQAALCDKATQNLQYGRFLSKTCSEQTKSLVRADIIDLLRDKAMKTVHSVPEDLTKFMNELLYNNSFCSTFGLVVDSQDISKNPTIQSLVKEYHACMDKEKKREVRRTLLKQTGKVCICNLLKDSHVTLSGEKTPEHFRDRVTAANSNGRLTCYGDERRRILSIVAMD